MKLKPLTCALFTLGLLGPAHAEVFNPRSELVPLGTLGGSASFAISFLVSDGLYFGEGAFPAMQRDTMAGPILQQVSELVRLVTIFSKRSKEY